MDVSKMDQTWVPSMPPLLSPNLKVFWTKLWHCAFTRKNLKAILKKLGNLKGKTNGAETLHKTILQIHYVTTAFRIADTPAEPQTDLRW